MSAPKLSVPRRSLDAAELAPEQPVRARAGRTQLYVDIQKISRAVSKRRSVAVSQTVRPD